MSTCRKSGVAVLAGCLALAIFGCHDDDHDTGRVPVGDDTPGEKRSAKMRVSDLNAAADDVAQALAADINRLSAEDWGPYRVTLVWGDVKNNTYTMPTSDFELLQSKLRDKLLSSQFVRDNVKIVAGRGRVSRIREREDIQNMEPAPPPPEEDLLGKNPPQAPPDQAPPHAVAPHDAAYTYMLLGEAHGMHRGGTHYYYISFQIVHSTSREIVFSKDYDVKYRPR